MTVNLTKNVGLCFKARDLYIQSDKVSNIIINKYKICFESKLNTIFYKNLNLKVLQPLSEVSIPWR
jgi:hypothetical protein